MSGWTTGNGGGPSYSTQDMIRMQREAAERVREMQERSRRVLEETPVYPDFVRKPEQPRHPDETHTEKQSHQTSEAQHSVRDIPGPKAQPLPHQPIVQEHERPGGILGALSSSLGGSGGILGNLGGSGGILGNLGGLLHGNGDGPISRVMDALGIDNDKIIVLMLLLILLNNNADKKLILALCYILL